MLTKICGLCRTGDAAVAEAAGATHAGVVRIPGTPRWRPLETARAVLDAAPGLRRVGVFADAGADAVRSEAEGLRLDVVQLHGDERGEEIVLLKEAGLEVWKVVKPDTGAALLEAARRFEVADLLLVEGASRAGRGGVGARFDWTALAPVWSALARARRLGVAGGLRPDNVAEAVATLRPALVDVSSGVEAAPGEKDHERVRAFVAEARAAVERETVERETVEEAR